MQGHRPAEPPAAAPTADVRVSPAGPPGQARPKLPPWFAVPSAVVFTHLVLWWLSHRKGRVRPWTPGIQAPLDTTLRCAAWMHGLARVCTGLHRFAHICTAGRAKAPQLGLKGLRHSDRDCPQDTRWQSHAPRSLGTSSEAALGGIQQIRGQSRETRTLSAGGILGGVRRKPRQGGRLQGQPQS